MNNPIKIGTRNSPLALWQANFIAQKLEQNGLKTELVPITSTGDKILHKSLAKIGSKGVFTQDLEAMLDKGEIHIAVHSAKDIPTQTNQYQIIAFTHREMVQDVILSHDPNALQRESVKIGTSATRRIGFVKHYFPNARQVEVRGNLQTRLKKLEDQHCDALILAFAGVKRIEKESFIIKHLPIDTFVPPAGQGSIGIQAHIHLPSELTMAIRSHINDPISETCITLERALLSELGGGCSIPIFAHAMVLNERQQIKFTAGIISLDGQEMIKNEVQGPLSATHQILHQMVEELEQNGVLQLLTKVKNQL